MAYGEALERMHQAVAERAADRIADTLQLVRHPPVITLGRKRGATESVLVPRDIPVVAVERGGDATYHGPGQLVAYPIFKLGGADRDLHRFLRRLEQTVIAALDGLGVAGERSPGLTGVWVGRRKIASIGVAVRSWVSYHGVSLDVAPDPGFMAIRPCGMDSQIMTSLEEVLGRPVDFGQVRQAWLDAFCRVFDFDGGDFVCK